MSLDFTTIEDALYSWIFGELAIETIFSHPNAPRPTGNYATINITENTDIGWNESQYTREIDESITADHSNLSQIMVSVNVYRGSALSQVKQLKDSICKITVQDLLTNSELGFIRSSSVRDIPDVVKKSWEQRGQIDFFFHVRSLTTETIEEIKKIEITNELDGSTTTIEQEG